jgi:hypothetical protein
VIETSPLSAVLVQIDDFVEEAQLDFDAVKTQVEESYISIEASRKSRSYIDQALTELKEGKTLELLSNETNLDIETYKNLKRDSSLLSVQAVNDIFSLPRSMAGNIFGASFTQNGDSLIFRLDSVKEGSQTLNEESLQSVSNFLNQQKTISEVGELQLKIQDSLSIVRID